MEPACQHVDHALLQVRVGHVCKKCLALKRFPTFFEKKKEKIDFQPWRHVTRPRKNHAQRACLALQFSTNFFSDKMIQTAQIDQANVSND
jgi:hypothetical protein